jgi:hypothetical protein
MNRDIKTAYKNGWHISHNPKPIPDRSNDWDYWHDDSEVCYTAASFEDAVEEVEEQILEDELAESKAHKWPLVEAQKRIAALEKVAEATAEHLRIERITEPRGESPWLDMIEDALRSAGYLKEKSHD